MKSDKRSKINKNIIRDLVFSNANFILTYIYGDLTTKLKMIQLYRRKCIVMSTIVQIMSIIYLI